MDLLFLKLPLIIIKLPFKYKSINYLLEIEWNQF